MISVECHGYSIVQGTGLEIAGEHCGPGDGLQQRPVRAERGDKRKNNQDFAEP